MNLANKLTILRIVLVVPFVIFLQLETTFFNTLALIIFIIVSISDYLDGLIARIRNEVSNLGKFLDPLADKIITSAAFIIFIKLDELSVPAWPVILIISREFIINGLRTYAASKGIIIAASMAGKIKTVSQITAIILILLILITRQYEYYASYIVILTSIITVFSGVVYLMRNRDVFKESE